MENKKMLPKNLNFVLPIFLFVFCLISPLLSQSTICIVIPAYNEESRIKNTLQSYAQYFATKPEKTTFLVVANNCKDNTVGVSRQVQAETNEKNNNVHIEILDLKPGGKGFAVKEGFLWALAKEFDLIGFVDADMATKPQYFYDLIIACRNADGAIASRYIKGADVFPSRPWLRKLGGKFYNWMLRTKLHIPFRDTQCGAKIFTKDTIAKVAPHMTEKKWAFDLELLYLCRLENKLIKEIPTTWSDQPGSKLSISSNLIKDFLDSPNRIKKNHAALKKDLLKQQRSRNKNVSKKFVKKAKVNCSVK